MASLILKEGDVVSMETLLKEGYVENSANPILSLLLSQNGDVLGYAFFINVLSLHTHRCPCIPRFLVKAAEPVGDVGVVNDWHLRPLSMNEGLQANLAYCRRNGKRLGFLRDG